MRGIAENRSDEPSRMEISIAVGIIGLLFITLLLGGIAGIFGGSAYADTETSMSTGCGLSYGSGEYSETTVDGNGTSRTYHVILPNGYDSSRAYPLVFVFHGAGASGESAESWGLQNAGDAADSAIFVYPDGIPFENWGVGWNDLAGGYDLPFFDNMVSSLEGNYCVDSSGVYAAGFSWGGDFVTALVCERGNVLKAADVNSATDEFDNNRDYTTYANFPCSTTNYPALRYEHAETEDAAYPAPDFASTSELFTDLYGCSGEVESVEAPTYETGVRGEGCAAPFFEYSFDASIGHALPTDWAADVWTFFSGYMVADNGESSSASSSTVGLDSASQNVSDDASMTASGDSSAITQTVVSSSLAGQGISADPDFQGGEASSIGTLANTSTGKELWPLIAVAVFLLVSGSGAMIRWHVRTSRTRR